VVIPAASFVHRSFVLRRNERNEMKTITTRFLDRDAMSGALVALTDVHVHPMGVGEVRSRPGDAKRSALDFGASLGTTLGVIGAGTAGVVAIVATGGAFLSIAAAMAAASGVAAGGMAGGLVGTMLAGRAPVVTSLERAAEHTPVVVSLDVPDAEATLAREVLRDAGGEVVEASRPPVAG
jgi:anti-sigma factor RsiW